MKQIRDKILLKKIAARVKQLRKERNLRQLDFYHDTEIHIGRIESGNSNISVSTLNAICKYFNISIFQYPNFFQVFNPNKIYL